MILSAYFNRMTVGLVLIGPFNSAFNTAIDETFPGGLSRDGDPAGDVGASDGKAAPTEVDAAKNPPFVDAAGPS